MKWRILYLSGVILVFIVSSCGREEKPIEHTGPDPDSISNVLQNLHAEEKAEVLGKYFDSLYTYHAFNGNVLISQRGQVIFMGMYGYADFRLKDTLTVNSTFQLASVSKQFTAIGILMLYEQGKLDLADTIQKFFPGFPYSGITVHMLLTHRSGLPNYIYFIDEIVKDKYTFISNQAVIRLMTKFRPDRYYPPDMTFDYSNTGYMLLAAIIEKVSGLDYGDYMDKNIFKPLGMDHTVVYNRNRNTEIQYRTSGYLYRTKEAENNFLNGITGDKGIYTSIEDMHKWDRALYTDSLLKRETIMLAFQPMGKSRDAFENYGYGWRMYNSGDTMKVLYHGGWWQGYHNMYVRLEKDSTAIIILKNKKTRHAVNHEELFGILYRRF